MAACPQFSVGLVGRLGLQVRLLSHLLVNSLHAKFPKLLIEF